MSLSFNELTRKLIHVAVGFLALLLAFITWWQALLLGLVALVHNLFILPIYLRRIFRGEGKKTGYDPGIAMYPASILVLVLIFHRRLEIVAAAWGLLAFGDGFATIVGRTVGGPKLPWNRTKSWSGYVAFIVIGFLAARFLFVWTYCSRFLRSSEEIAGTDTLATYTYYDFFLDDPLQHQVIRIVYEDPSALSTIAGLVHALTSIAMQFGWGPIFVAIILATTLLAATLESLPIGVDDNLAVTIVPAGFLYALSLFDPHVWASHRGQVLWSLPWAIGVNLLLAVGAYAARSVSVSGVIGGVAVGSALFAFGGWRAFMMLLVFFVLGTAATKMGYAKKAALGIAQEKGGRRGAKNAVANCGMGALLALVAATTPPLVAQLALLGLVAAFATAAADTVSSEIGQAYGRRTFLITSFRPVPPGTEGAVSLEGTLAGAAAGGVVALAGFSLGLIDPLGAAIATAAAFFGSTLESYVGALWSRAKQVDNEAINFANTAAGALFAMLIIDPVLSLGGGIR